MIKNYFLSELLLTIKRWQLLVINVLYFFVPVFFFQIISMPIVDNNNKEIFDIIASGVFMIVFMLVLQFFIFNKIIQEYNSGIILNKFCLPLKNSTLILCDVIVQNIFGFILLICCFLANSLIFNINYNVLICGAILIPSCVCVTYSYSLLFFAKNENIVLASVFSFFSLLPLLFFISNIIQNIFITQNIIIASLYSLLVVIVYVVKTSFVVNNISI